VLRYFIRKLFIYGLTFIVAVTVDWAIPHLMPGNPVLALMSRINAQDPRVAQTMYHHYMRAFNLDLPLWKQYWYFWVALAHGDLGTSIVQFPTSVSAIILHAAPYTLGLLVPAILLSWYAGNKVGAMAARRKVLDNSALPVSYALTATPYMWLAILLSWVFAVIWHVFPSASRMTRPPSARSRGRSSGTSSTTGSCRSYRCSSSPSEAGRSGCGT
jgi:peptide/nickel transport system permease protein